jgi:hypothetical protein
MLDPAAIRVIAAANVGATALILVVVMGLIVLRWGTAHSEMTDASRQKFVGCGFALLVLGLLGCVVAFGIMVSVLTHGL